MTETEDSDSSLSAFLRRLDDFIVNRTMTELDSAEGTA